MCWIAVIQAAHAVPLVYRPQSIRPVLHPPTFTKNRDRLFNEKLMARLLEHFSVDGTLLRARASHSSLEPIDRSDDD